MIPTNSAAQFYEKMFSFTQARRDAELDGRTPRTRLVEGRDGNLYGTTYYGGDSDVGTIFKMTPEGELTTIYDFPGGEMGAGPRGGLVEGIDGNFYGTTYSGGSVGPGLKFGTVFKISPLGELITLVRFNGLDPENRGSNPLAGLVEAGDGNFYGTTSGYDGIGDEGTIFKITPGGEMTTLVEFSGTGGLFRGSSPQAELIEASDGNFYGTTKNGGGNDLGTVFMMTPAGQFTTLVEFDSSGGNRPESGLTEGPDGSFYGSTSRGGSSDAGTVIKITTNGTAAGTSLMTLGDNINKMAGRWILASDGKFYGLLARGEILTVNPSASPGEMLTQLGRVRAAVLEGSLIQASDGSFYGTSFLGGESGEGKVFKIVLVPGGEQALEVTTLFEFPDRSSVGRFPRGGLVLGDDGQFYGATYRGGTSVGLTGNGTIFGLSAGGELSTLIESAGSRFGLLQANNGHFYGITDGGGVSNDGTVFRVELTPGGDAPAERSKILDFSGVAGDFKGGRPWCDLIEGIDGRIYGVTYYGGANDWGTIFCLTLTPEDGGVAAFETLFEFSGMDGRNPVGGLFEDQAKPGTFYGVTTRGGIGWDDPDGGHGTVFQIRLTPGGPAPAELTTLWKFAQWSRPEARVIQASDGHLYGTTERGGSGFDGTIFKVELTPGGPEPGIGTTLIDFSDDGAINRGRLPRAPLIEREPGVFYGTTLNGATNDAGSVFQMTLTPGQAEPAELTTIYEFGNDGAEGLPYAGLTLAPDGNLYGTTGGIGDGIVYRLVFEGPPNVFPLSPVVESTSSAVIASRANARGSQTTVWVEIGTNVNLPDCGDDDSVPGCTELASNLTGFRTGRVAATINGLDPGVTYYYRFRAINSKGEETISPVGTLETFTTLAEPNAAVSAATNILPTSATFNGTVNARTFDTTLHFEYGTDGNTFPSVAVAAPAMATGGTDTPVSSAVAGLIKGTTYFYRIVATNIAGTTVSGVQSFTTLTDPVVTIGGSSFVTSNSASVSGTVNAMGSDTQVVFEYGTDGISFPNSVGAAPATVTGDSDTTVTANLTGLNQGDLIHYRIRATSAGGVTVSGVEAFVLDILSGFDQQFPSPPPPAAGFVIVTLEPPGIGGGWRFVGEQIWRKSGVPAGFLPTGDREVEFRPVPGFQQPLREFISVISGEAATFLDREYFQLVGEVDTGSLNVTIQPESITLTALPEVERAQWRLLGEDDTAWRESGATEMDLFPGNYLVELKPLAGRNTPAVLTLSVPEGGTRFATATYRLADSNVGTLPEALPYATVSGDQSLPYAYVGQVRSNSGAGSGFVVKERVVATAAHVVYDDGDLEYVTGLNWSFQRDRQSFEPVSLEPRGIYVFEGYAAARDPAQTPGVIPGEGTAESQNLDVAVLYFQEPAGRGGFSGFLASDASENEFLTSSELKTLVGYPLDNIPVPDQGRMHATPPANVAFASISPTLKTYTTSEITSRGGNSGGPLCVQFVDGKYYPAAVYLGGSGGQSIVRAIDSDMAEMFRRAEVSADTGHHQTGGGIAHQEVQSTFDPLNRGFVRVLIPDVPGAGWKIEELDPAGEDEGFREPSTTVSVRAEEFTIVFKEVPGFDAPPPEPFTANANQIVEITGTYAAQGFGGWAASNLSEFPGLLQLPGADPDFDGLINLVEFAFNLKPGLSDQKQFEDPLPLSEEPSGLPRIGLVNDKLQIISLRRKNAAALGLSYHYEFSSDAVNWQEGFAFPLPIAGNSEWELSIAIDPAPAGLSRRIARVRIEEPLP